MICDLEMANFYNWFIRHAFLQVYLLPVCDLSLYFSVVRFSAFLGSSPLLMVYQRSCFKCPPTPEASPGVFSPARPYSQISKSPYRKTLSNSAGLMPTMPLPIPLFPNNIFHALKTLQPAKHCRQAEPAGNALAVAVHCVFQ